MAGSISQKAKKKKFVNRARFGMTGIPIDKGFPAMKDYFHYELDKKHLIKIMKDYIKETRTKSEYDAVMRLPDTRLYMYDHYNAVVWAIKNDVPFVGWYKDYDKSLRKFISELIEDGMKVKKLERVAEKKGPVPKAKSVYQRMAEKVMSTIIVDIENLEDQWMTGEPFAIIDVYTQFKVHGLPAKAVDLVRPTLEAWLEEFTEAYNKPDGDIAWGFKHVPRKELKHMMSQTTVMLADLDRIKENKQAVKIPKKFKVVSMDKQVGSIQYLKESDEFKLVSLSPVKIIGATVLLTFNPKYRAVTQFFSVDDKGFSVKGTTLQNVDFEKSRAVKLRKPEEFLPIVKTGNIKKIEVEWKKLTTKTYVPNGRINNDTLLLRTMT